MSKMRVSIISFTQNGMALSGRIQKICPQMTIRAFTKCSAAKQSDTNIQYVEQSLKDWTKEQMEQKNVLVFIGACAIAVRAIAPCITDKLHDSPVLVLDENGTYVIPILAGHIGGANELAVSLAKELQAQAVITTATDIQEKFAVDMFAKKNGLHIVNKDGIAKVSAKVLAGEMVTMSIEEGHVNGDMTLPAEVCMMAYPPTVQVDILITSKEENFDAVLLLKPKEYVIGMGCRKGKEAEKIEAFIQKHLQEIGINEEQIYALASIEQKKEEEGFLIWSQKRRLPFLTYTSEQLQEVEGVFQESSFVQETVGVSNVCERAALKVAGDGGRLVYKKHAEDGMTIAIAKREWNLR